MCDINAGQLILCFSRDDPAARNLLSSIRRGEVEHVSYVESIATKLEKAGLKPDPHLGYEVHLVNVPEGQENWKSHYLQSFYKYELLNVWPPSDPQVVNALLSHQFIAAPNHVLSLSQVTGHGRPVSAAEFAFEPAYQQYKQLVRLPAAHPGGATVRVVVLDSGLAADAPQRMKGRVVSMHNLVGDAPADDARDTNGHGTAITLLIDDLAPNVEFVVIRVADAEGLISEWDALAGLVADTHGHVVNLSVQFGLPPRAACKVCGRKAESTASRSAVFENLVEQARNRPERPILVAAAGNAALPQLAYPSRFDAVVAVGALTGAKTLSPISNYGNVAATGDPHPYHFVMPGGEPVLSSKGGHLWFGTSFATAFATAVVSTRMSRQGWLQYDRERFLEDTIKDADLALPDFSETVFGRGLMRA